MKKDSATVRRLLLMFKYTNGSCKGDQEATAHIYWLLHVELLSLGIVTALDLEEG